MSQFLESDRNYTVNLRCVKIKWRHHCLKSQVFFTSSISGITFSFQFSSVAQLCPILCDPMNCSTPGLPVHHHLLESIRLTSIESVMPSSHLILCCPLLLLPPIPPSIIVYSNESTLLMRWQGNVFDPYCIKFSGI